MNLRAISWRFKIPLAFVSAILLTEFVVALALIRRASADAESDLRSSARNLIAVIARSVREPMVRDDLWQIFEVVRTPVLLKDNASPLKSIVVLNSDGEVLTATDPLEFPLATALAVLPISLQRAVGSLRDTTFFMDAESDPERSAVVAAGSVLSEDGTKLGSVVVEFNSAVYDRRLRETLGGLVLVSLPGLLILVPLAWLLGHALAQPLVRLESVLANVGNTSPELLAGQLPSNQARDEIGRLTEQAGTLLLGMAEKERLESAAVASERLAAVGRVSGVIAHEINNPLGGMLTAIDTARTHGDPTPMIDRFLQLLDRGLRQIQGTVSALLVEARLDSPNVLREDWQDLLTLVKPQTDRISLIWRVSETLPATIQLPAHAVRQICLNLLLNSIKAASSASHAHDDVVDATTRIRDGRANESAVGSAYVRFEASERDGRLEITVANTGAAIESEKLARIFEPLAFSTQRDGRASHGLGLWICYQLTQSLGGAITAISDEVETRFEVNLPLSGGNGSATHE